MEFVESLLQDWIPTIITLVIFSAILYGANWLLLKTQQWHSHHNKFPRQLLMLFLTLVAVVAVVIALPIKESTESQVLGLIGLILSGLLAFSSTTIVGNLVAGFMMRFTQPFRTGDFIKVEQFAGRVTERGLFDSEIQTETSELVGIPNNFLITHPVTVVRNAGTIISVSLSLGYDVHHSEVETLLIEAALQSDLQDPFVHVTDLGNYAVTYKISGMLLDVKNLLTARSTLYRHVLDTLHASQIEIMSPSFMNQRKVADERLVIPQVKAKSEQQQQTVAEDIVFDKAEEAEQFEKQEQALSEEIERLKSSQVEARGDSKVQIENKIAALQEELKAHQEAHKEAVKQDNKQA